MPDPHVLYVVTAIVVLGLVSWVVVVLSRPDTGARIRAGLAPLPEGSRSTSLPPVKGDGKPTPPPPPGEETSKLDPHAEIRDHQGGFSMGEVSVDIEEEEEPTGPVALILVTAVGRTDPGLKRKHNEDAYAILEDHHLFVIADGMGRHAAGEIASQLCVDAITESFRTQNFGPPREPPMPRRASRLRGSILLGNERILASARATPAYTGMGTTVVAAYFSANNQRVYIAHVGDSRCYRLRGDKLTQLTTDHTLGAFGVQGKSAAVLSRAVGVEESVDVDVTMESPLPGDIYLLCSDGLSRMVKDEAIRSILEKMKDLEEVNRLLIETANQGGGRDNITAILVRVDDARLNPTVRPVPALPATSVGS